MKLEEYRDDNGNTVMAHVVTEETAGEEVQVIGGTAVKTYVGIVVLATDRPGVYDTVPASTFTLSRATAPEPAFPSPVSDPEPDGTGEDD